jgi:hypothetical protein
MEETQTETLDSTTEGQEENLEEQISIEQYEAIKTELEKEKQSKAKIYARAKRAEELLKVRKPESDDLLQTNSDADWKEKMELKVEGFKSDEELDFIMKNGGKKAIDKPYVKAAIEAIRQQKQAEQAAVEGQDKTATKKGYTDDELRKMSTDELYKLLPKSEQ